MRMTVINHLVCPACSGDFLLSTRKKTKERTIEGELKCKKCSRKFYIKNGIACFASCIKKQFERDAQKLRRTTLEQEIPKKWMHLFLKQEFMALKKEWEFLLSVVKKDKSVIHLDFATGTGRFLRNIISKTNGEIVTLDNGYGTCQELQYFLKRIRKYNRVSIVCADAREMPFKNGVFNSVSTWHGLDEPKIEKVIKETKRVLKKGGYFTASGVHYQKGSKSFLRAKKYSIRFIAKEAIIQSMKKIGLRKVKHKIFFRGRWTERGDYLPIFNDLYLTYAVRAEK